MRAVLDQRSTDLLHPQRSLLQDIFAFLGFVLLAFAAAVPAIWSDPQGFYATLQKPTWAPPPWIFGPVWTVLYCTIGLSAWGVWHRHGWTGAHGLWFVQLLFNAAWTPVFFGLREPGFALGVIVLLWLAILGTIAATWRQSRWAGAVLLPYLAWVSFATALNFAIWRLNS